MKNIDLLKVAYVFDGHKGYTLPCKAIKAINSFLVEENLYLSATREIDLLTSQDDIEMIRTSDYIKNPKPNGYRSLHLIVTVPVYLSDRKELVKVEIQIRTIAMNFWASLEHELSFKLTNEKNIVVTQELKDCADVISNIDIRMQNLHNITIMSFK